MRNERDILAYLLVIVPRDIPSFFCVELHWTADDCCRRNPIQVLIAWVSGIRHCNRRGFCGSNSSVREPFDFALWLLRRQLLCRSRPPRRQHRFALPRRSLLLLLLTLPSSLHL